MPNYRIHVKLEGKQLQEYEIFDYTKDIEDVYHDYRRRVIQKNGAGRVEYFDLVMIAEKSLLYKDDRQEVFNPENNFRISVAPATAPKRRKEKRSFTSGIPLGERRRD